MKNTILLIVALGVLGIIGYLWYYDATQPTIVQLNSVDSSSTVTTNEASKTDEEARVELIEKGAEHVTALIKDERAAKRERDSIRLANRQPIWVYQIGGFKSDAEDFGETYKKLKEAGVSNIYIIKQSRKSFYLVKNDESSIEDLQYKLSVFKESLTQAGINEDVQVKDLHGYCESNDDAVADGDVKVAHKVRVECYNCN